MLRAGLAALALAYLGMAVARAARDRRRRSRSCSPAGTSRRWRCCWRWARGADPADPAGFTRFYMRVWKLFFLEYALVALACLAG